MDRWRISRGELFQIFTPFLEKDLICLLGLEAYNNSRILKMTLVYVNECLL